MHFKNNIHHIILVAFNKCTCLKKPHVQYVLNANKMAENLSLIFERVGHGPFTRFGPF